MSMIRYLSAGAFVLGTGLASVLAQAQTSDAATKEAQRLYQDAAKDMDARNYTQACRKLEAARKLLPEHVRTAISLAECYDKLGEPASALETFDAARALANTQKNADKIAEIDKKITKLQPRVPHLTISVPKEIALTPGLAITRNNEPVPVGQWGKALAINPGKYQIEVTAVEKSPWTTSAEIKIGNDSVLEIKPPWGTSDSSDAGGAPSNTSDSPPSSTSPLRTIGIVGISLGALGIGAGAILGGLAISKNNASDDGHCDAKSICDQTGFDLRTEARSLGNGSTASLIVGGVLAAGGIALFVVGGKKNAPSETAQTSLWVGPTSVGLRGRW